MEDKKQDHPRILVPPPVMIGGPFVLGMLLHWRMPIQFLPRWAGIAMGLLCAIPALILLLGGWTSFFRNRSSMLPIRAARVLIMDGPFRITRNPLYLGLILLCAGISFGLVALWPLLALPGAILWVQHAAILPEERYLAEHFGDEYREYQKRVPRWL